MRAVPLIAKQGRGQCHHLAVFAVCKNVFGPLFCFVCGRFRIAVHDAVGIKHGLHYRIHGVIAVTADCRDVEFFQNKDQRTLHVIDVTLHAPDMPVMKQRFIGVLFHELVVFFLFADQITVNTHNGTSLL